MYCFVILLLFNEMQMSVRRFSAIPHLKDFSADAGPRGEDCLFPLRIARICSRLRVREE